MTNSLELSELKNKILTLLNTDINNIGNALTDIALNNKYEIYDEYVKAVDNNLSVDYLQKIYQYYHADRKEKKQDYTPQTLAKFVGKLVGNSEIVVDMCAGSGALTIQRWNENHEQKFILYELDEKVIPFLLFNLAVRNISASVIRGDVLQNEILEQWTIEKGEKYGNITCIESTV